MATPANLTNPLELELPTESYVGGYHTGCQGHLFLNGTQYFGEAVGISYSQSMVKTPIYGHRSRYFDRMAEGQIIVQGNILVNLTDFRYMNAAVGFATGDLAKGADIPALSEQQFTLHRMPDLRGLSQREVEWVYQQALGGLAPATLDPAASFNIDMMLRETEEGLIDPLGERLNAAGMSMACLHTKPFDLVMILGSPNDVEREWYDRQNVTMRRIVQLHIVGEATEVMSNDNVLLQAFPFVARSLDYNQGPIKAQLKLSNGSKERIDRLRAQLLEAAKVYTTTIDLKGATNAEVPESPLVRARKRLKDYLENFLERYRGTTAFDLMRDVGNSTFLEGLADAVRDSGAEESISNFISDMLDRDFANGDGLSGLANMLTNPDLNSPTITPEQESAWKLIKRSETPGDWDGWKITKTGERQRNTETGWGISNPRTTGGTPYGEWKLTPRSINSHPPLEDFGDQNFQNIGDSLPWSFQNLMVEPVRRLPTDLIPDLDDPLSALEPPTYQDAVGQFGLF